MARLGHRRSYTIIFKNRQAVAVATGNVSQIQTKDIVVASSPISAATTLKNYVNIAVKNIAVDAYAISANRTAIGNTVNIPKASVVVGSYPVSAATTTISNNVSQVQTKAIAVRSFPIHAVRTGAATTTAQVRGDYRKPKKKHYIEEDSGFPVYFQNEIHKEELIQAKEILSKDTFEIPKEIKETNAFLSSLSKVFPKITPDKIQMFLLLIAIMIDEHI